jgi:hypothetical protein
MGIAAGLAATKAGFDLLKGARELLKRTEIDPGEIQARLLELQDLMLEARQALGDAEEENRELRSKLDDRESQKALEADLEPDPDAHFLVRKSEKEKGLFPYCPVCWGDKNALVRLLPQVPDQTFTCVIHKAFYHTNRWHQEQEAARRRVVPGARIGPPRPL